MTVALAQIDYVKDANLVNDFKITGPTGTIFDYNSAAWLAKNGYSFTTWQNISKVGSTTKPYSTDTFCVTACVNKRIEYGRDLTKYAIDIPTNLDIKTAPANGDSYLISRGVYTDVEIAPGYDYIDFSFNVTSLLSTSPDKKTVNVMVMDTNMNPTVSKATGLT